MTIWIPRNGLKSIIMGFHLKESFLKVCQQNNIRTAIKIVCIFHTRLYGRVMYKYEYCSTILMRNDIAILKILRYRKQNFSFSLVPAIKGHKNVSSLDFFCCSIALSYSYLSKNNNDLILVYHIFEKKMYFNQLYQQPKNMSGPSPSVSIIIGIQLVIIFYHCIKL